MYGPPFNKEEEELFFLFKNDFKKTHKHKENNYFISNRTFIITTMKVEDMYR